MYNSCILHAEPITMRSTIFNRIAISVLTLGTFFASAPHVRAETFTLPPQLVHEGLTFSPAGIFDRQLHLPTLHTRIAFLEPKKLKIKPNNRKRSTDIPVLESIVITPAEEKTKLLTKNSPTPLPTLFLSPTKTTPTIIQSTPTPITTSPAPTQIPQPPSTAPVTTTNPGGLDAEKLFNMANAYRQTKGLPPLQKDSRACELAVSRAPEINAEVAGGHMHSGLHNRNLPYWNTENIITMNSEESAFNWWINDTIHREAIEGAYTYSCVACSGNACAQEFTNFQPK